MRANLTWNKLATIGLVCLSSLWTVHCADERSPLSHSEVATGSIVVEAKVPEPDQATDAAAKAVLTFGRFVISGTGMDPIDRRIAIEGGLIDGRIEGIPVGERQVELCIEDNSGKKFWRAEETVILQKNTVVRVNMELVRIGDLAPEITRVNTVPNAPTANETVVVQATVNDLHDADEAIQVRWDYDGQPGYDSDWSGDKDIRLTFPKPGVYTVTVQARDRSGNIATVEQEITIEPEILPFPQGWADPSAIYSESFDGRTSLNSWVLGNYTISNGALHSDGILSVIAPTSFSSFFMTTQFNWSDPARSGANPVLAIRVGISDTEEVLVWVDVQGSVSVDRFSMATAEFTPIRGRTSIPALEANRNHLVSVSYNDGELTIYIDDLDPIAVRGVSLSTGRVGLLGLEDSGSIQIERLTVWTPPFINGAE